MTLQFLRPPGRLINFGSMEKSFSYTNRYGYVSRLQRKESPSMFLTDPVWLTALATLVTSLASLVWAFRRRGGGDGN